MHCMDGEWKCVARGDSDARGKKEKREKSSSLPPSSHFSGGSQHGTKRREREGIVDGKINKGNRALGGDDLAS